MMFSYSECPIGEPVFTRLQYWKIRIRREDDQVFGFVKHEVPPRDRSASDGREVRCLGLVELLDVVDEWFSKVFDFLGSWPAESKGKDLITECKMVLDGSSLSAARALIFVLRSSTGARSRFGAWQCSVGPERIASIVGLVWQRPLKTWMMKEIIFLIFNLPLQSRFWHRKIDFASVLRSNV